MRTVAVTHSVVYDKEDTVRLTRAEDIARFGVGPHKVMRHGGDGVTISVVKRVTLPEDAVTLHAQRPAWMEPDYVKCG